MKEQLQKRLKELEQEYQKGEQRLEVLTTETEQVKTTMLRLSGAIQVLQEELQIGERQEDIPSENGVPRKINLS